MSDLFSFLGYKQGIYEIFKIINDKPSWISKFTCPGPSMEQKRYAIWYIPNHKAWGIGDLKNIGTEKVGIGKSNF